MALAGVSRAELEWTRGQPSVFASSSVVERGFCARCGTPLTYTVTSSDRVSVAICSLDDPAAVPPKRQYSPGTALPWLKEIESLPGTDDLFPPGVQLPIANHQHPDHDT